MKLFINSQTSTVQTLEVWEWINNFILYFIMDVVTYPCMPWSKLTHVKRGPRVLCYCQKCIYICSLYNIDHMLFFIEPIKDSCISKTFTSPLCIMHIYDHSGVSLLGNKKAVFTFLYHSPQLRWRLNLKSSPLLIEFKGTCIYTRSLQRLYLPWYWLTPPGISRF